MLSRGVNDHVVVLDEADVFSLEGEATGTPGPPLDEGLIIVVVALLEDHVGRVEQASDVLLGALRRLVVAALVTVRSRKAAIVVLGGGVLAL